MSEKQRVVKIIVIGPSQSGKTAIANYLANRLDGIQKDYRPTAALRIVEFNKEAPVNRKRPGQETATIQLWDGNNSFIPPMIYLLKVVFAINFLNVY